MEHRPQFTPEQIEWLCELIDEWGGEWEKNDTVIGFEFAKNVLKALIGGITDGALYE